MGSVGTPGAHQTARHAFAARHPWPGPSGCSPMPQRRNRPRFRQSSTGIPAETGDFPAEKSDFPAERSADNGRPAQAGKAYSPSGLTRRCRAWRRDRCRPAVGRHPFYLFLSTFMTAEGCSGPVPMASLRFHKPPYPTRLRATRLSAGRPVRQGH